MDIQSIKHIRKDAHTLYPWELEGADSLLATILEKAQILPKEATSGQGANLGRKQHPFDMVQAQNLKNFNSHHSTCVETKVACTVGTGPKKENLVDILDPLCEVSFDHLIKEVDEDNWTLGNCYIEVVRDGDGTSPILGLHHQPAGQAYFNIEDNDYNSHWEIIGGETSHTGDLRFARFGDKDNFLERMNAGISGNRINPEDVSELIAIPRSSAMSRWYGFPDWLSAVASIELVQCLHQHTFDFFLNRGVPEFLLFITGQEIGGKDWDELKSTLQANIGLGHSHKSGAFNFPHAEMKIQLEKLAMEGKTDGLFAELSDSLALGIVSAHRVPPLLAGIQIPGKLGATNELPNALVAFQTLVIGPAQRDMASALGCTLGDASLNGGLSLGKKDFEWKTITDQFPLQEMDTMGRMRESVASSNGRDLSEGVRT